MTKLSVLQIEQNKQLASSSLGLKYCGKNQSYMTWLAVKLLLHISPNRTDRYGKQSPKCNYILNQDDHAHFKLKTLTKGHIINKYWAIYGTYVISYSAYILWLVYFPLSFSFFFFPLSIPSILFMHIFLCCLLFYVYILYYQTNFAWL